MDITNNANNEPEDVVVNSKTTDITEDSPDTSQPDISDTLHSEDTQSNSTDIQIVLTEENMIKERRINKNVILKILIIVSIVIILSVAGIFVRNIINSNNQIKAVENTINNIGDVELTTECKEKIDIAVESYNSLSDKQKEKVKNISSLSSASTTYNSLLYYDKLISACNYTNKKASAAVDILNGMKTVWNNVIQHKTDEYNNGKYDFNTALDAYWDSYDCLSNSLQLYDDINKDDNGKTINDYLSELKNPPEEYDDAYNAFTSLYAAYSSMVPLTKEVHHTYSAFSSEVSSLISDYKAQHGKAKALIPEIE
ncbi:MAG: hypothetical protein ACI38A_07275 [Candidatus Ornithomonoglobus sp.]